MAWRETRGAWRHFLYFFVGIAVGVSALVGVSVFAAHVEHAVSKQAKGLLGGDLEVRSSHPLSTESRAVLEGLDPRGIRRTHVSELVAMAAHSAQGSNAGHATQIVELKAVEPAYPLYGALKTDPALPLDRLLSPAASGCKPVCHGAVVQEALLLRMGLAVGDRLKIGKSEFLITGIVQTEPDRIANAFSLGPRVIISQAGLNASALIQPGSRVRERELLQIPAGMPLEPLRAELRSSLAPDRVRVSGYRDAQPQLKQFLEQLSRYLGLVGLTALFIGGVGVAMAIHAFMKEKLKTIAILKTLGGDTPLLIGVYVVQAVGLGLIGSAAGMLLGILFQRVLPPLLAGGFVTDLLDQVGASTDLTTASIVPLLKGGALGVLTTLLFSLWPLLRVRDIAPSAIFRGDVDPDGEVAGSASRWSLQPVLRDRARVVMTGLVLGGLGALSVWQASGTVGVASAMGVASCADAGTVRLASSSAATMATPAPIRAASPS